jgi:hypothetical protein
MLVWLAACGIAYVRGVCCWWCTPPPPPPRTRSDARCVAQYHFMITYLASCEVGYFKGKRVVELGAGTGLAGIALSLQGTTPAHA